MTASPAPQVLHALPGRLRVHVAEWGRSDVPAFEAHIRRLAGVREARASALTGNVLVHFDRGQLDEGQVVAHVAAAAAASPGPAPRIPSRLDLAVHDIAHHPERARDMVSHLERRQGVRARVHPWSGRLLIEVSEKAARIEDILGDIAAFGPEFTVEDRAREPLDPMPLVEGALRVGLASVGLVVIGARRLLGRRLPLLSNAALPSRLVGGLAILQIIPALQRTLERAIGRVGADLVFYVPYITSLMLLEGTLGLVLSVVEGVSLVREVTKRRAAWRRFEARRPDTTRTPTLWSEARPRPVRDAAQDRYVRGVALGALGHAAVMFGVSGSVMRAFQALLLVNPRTAVIAAEEADLAAYEAVLEAGVVVTGARHGRPIRQPDDLIVDDRIPQDGEAFDALLSTCARRNVRLEIVPARNARLAVRHRQSRGARVFFVGLGEGVAAGYAAADLAISLDAADAPIDVGADLIAPDLYAVARIIESGQRREAATRDGVAWSLLSNGVGALTAWSGPVGLAHISQPIYATALAAIGLGWLRFRL